MLPAILCGVVAKDRIRKSGGALTGDGIATAGIVLGSIWAVVFVIAFALPNLGTKDNADEFSGSEKAIAEVIDRVERAIADDHGEEACAELFTTAFAAKLARGTGTRCPDAVDAAIADGQLQAEIDVEKIVVGGELARARVREGSDEQTWRLRRQGRRWLVDAIDAGR